MEILESLTKRIGGSAVPFFHGQRSPETLGTLEEPIPLRPRLQGNADAHS